MEGDNQQIPGFGFDPGFEPKPLPPVPTPSSSSIFGLISKVNQGILKEPQAPFSDAHVVKVNPALQQAKAIAQKLSDISPQLAKQKAFQTAKATIENIQRGIWNPPGCEKNEQSSSSTDFKVPVVKSVPKQGILSNKGQIQSTSTIQSQNYAVTTSRPQTNTAQALGTGRSLVAYNDSSKQTNNFTRQEALNEIDQYRGEVARPYDRDHTYEETTKKAEPFKSDFDRYYFGNETQRSEIADKLHRNERQGDYDSKKGYTSYSPIGPPDLDTGHTDTDETYPRNDKPSNNSMTESHDNNYHQMFQNKRYCKPDSENYTRPVVPDSSNFPKPFNNYYVGEERENFRNRSLSAESLTRDYTLQRDGNPGKAYFVQKERETTSSEIAGYYSSSSDLRPTYSGWGHEKQTNEKSMLSTGAYMNKNKTRNTGTEHNIGNQDSWGKSERHETYLNERRASSAIDKSGIAHSKNIEGSNKRAGLVGDTKEKYNDNHEFKHNVDVRHEERNRSRDSFYDGRLDWYRSRDNRGNDNYRYYDRKRDENRTDDFDDYMANMEEVSDESDLDDSSQGRKILYEDFLFGEDEEKSDRMLKSESNDKKYGYGRRNEELEEKRHRDKKGSFIENDRNSSRSRNEVQGLDQSGGRRRDIVHRMEGQRPGTDGRYLPMTDDQKAQVEKPVSANRGGFTQTVPPPTVVGMPTGIASTSLSQQHGVPMLTGVSTLPLQVRPLQQSLSTPTRMSILPAVLQTSFPAPLAVPRPASGLPSSLPAPTAIPPPSSILQTSVRASVAIPQPTGVLMPSAQVPVSTAIPQPVGVLPPPLLSTTAIPPPSTAIPPPGIICKDCDVTCMDKDVYNAHLKSDAHLLNLQRRAQELFHMEKRSSRFDVDSAGNPLKAPVLPPTTMTTGVPSSTLSSSMPGLGIGRNVFAGNVSPVRDSRKESRQESLQQHKSKSDPGVQVIPPKPLGPLETRSVHGTWLVLNWRSRHEDEEALIDKYVVEYRNAREIRWVRVGATVKHEFEVNGLQEGTDYLFRVYTTNRDERSEYLESVLVTTKKRRDSREREKRISTREKLRERAERFRRERERRSIRDRHQKSIRAGDRKKASGESKRKGDKKQDHDRKTGRDSRKESRPSGQKKDSEGSKSVKKQTKDDKVTPETKTVSDLEEKTKEENNGGVEKTEVKSAAVEVDKPEETKQEEVECLLYREFPHYQNEPMLGLDNIYEIRNYMPKTPPRYVCKLCNNKGSHKIIVKHIIGFPHKLNYFKKYNAEIYDIINMIALKKQQVERANYEARLEEDRLGRGSVRVTLMLNPQDNNGKTVYTDPVPVKAPPPARQKETGEAPEAYDGDYQSQFEAIYYEAIENGTLTDSTLIGMDYIKEILHPKMEKEPKYTCSMCSVMCYDTTILSHLVGKKHRFNYLKVYHEEAYNEIMNTKENRHQLLIDKIREFAEKDGPGTIKTKVAKNGRMWRDKVSKSEEAQAEEVTEGKEEEEGNNDEAQQTEEEQGAKESKSGGGVQAIKFDIKKNEPQQTNVKPINVLEQEQATPKHKEAFDWNKENSLLQSRIHNETTIRSSRKSRFLTVYSEFFKKYPVIGMQWVTEFQKQDVKQEPWYMCFMCQQKLQWKSILDHVTSNLHRLNYMKKSDYRQKYNAVYHAIKKDKQSARPLIEQYSKEISDIEGPPTELEVMLELNVNTEAFKSVAKVQENMKAHASAVTSSQSIQINIISTTVSDTPATESVSSVVQASSGQQPATTRLSSEQTFSQNMPLGAPAGSVAPKYQEQSSMQFQSQAGQSQVQPPPLRAPPLRPPLLRPPPSLVPNTSFPPPSVQLTQVNRLTTASNPSSTLPYPSNTNAPVRLGTVGTMTPPTRDVSAAQGQLQMMPGPHNPSSINTMQSVMTIPVYRAPLASGPLGRPLPLLQTPQMGQVFPPRPLALPASVQQPLLQGPPQTVPPLAVLQPTTSIAPVISAPGTSLSSAYMQGSSNLIGHKPPPWQRQPPSIQHESVMSLYQQQSVPHMMIDQSLNVVNVDDVPQLNTSPLGPTDDKSISGPETIGSSSQVDEDINTNNDRRYKDQSKPPWLKYDQNVEDSQERQEKFQDTDRNNSKRVEEAERGIKRFGGQTEYDINKRLRSENRVSSLNNEMKDQSSEKISSNKRLSQGYGDRREIDQRRSDSRGKDQGRRNSRDSREDSRDKTGGNTRDTDKRRAETRFRDQRRFDDRGKGQESISSRDRGLQRGGSRERNQRLSCKDRGLPVRSIREKDLERFNIEDRNKRGVDCRDGGQRNENSRERDRRSDELDPRRDSGERRQKRWSSDERAQRRGGSGERVQRRGDYDERAQRRGDRGDWAQRRGDSGERGQRRGDSGERGPRKMDDKSTTERSLNSRDRQQRNRDSRERQRSRSPLRSDRRRSPVHTRLRDDSSFNGNDKYGRLSEHSPSPRRKIPDRSRKSSIHYLDTQEQACHNDEQMPIEGYNSPLDEAKVDDLVRLYVDREDDDYENFMAYEGEFDDTSDMTQGANRKDVGLYGRKNENYYNERDNQRTEFIRKNQHDERHVNERDNQRIEFARKNQHDERGFKDYMYERDTRGRSENITIDKYIEGGDEYIDNNTDRYSKFSETGYSMTQGFRGKGGVNQEYAFDNRGNMQFENRRIDNYNTYTQCYKDGENLETEPRNIEGWQSGFTQERRAWQEDVSNNRDDRQSYGGDGTHLTETSINRRDFVTDLETDKQRDRYGDKSFFDEGNEQDDHIPDPSREEIDELLRRAANTLVTSPHHEFSEYEEKMPAENISHQGSGASYQRGGRGNHGYRGFGPRSGR